MKVVRRGEIQSKIPFELECLKCHCVIEVTEEEMNPDLAGMTNRLWIDCPDCGYRMYGSYDQSIMKK